MRYPPVTNVQQFIRSAIDSRTKPLAKYDAFLAVSDHQHTSSSGAASEQSSKPHVNPFTAASSQESKLFANSSTKHQQQVQQKPTKIAKPKPLPSLFGHPTSGSQQPVKQVPAPVRQSPEVKALIDKEAKIGALMEKLIEVIQKQIYDS